MVTTIDKMPPKEAAAAAKLLAVDARGNVTLDRRLARSLALAPYVVREVEIHAAVRRFCDAYHEQPEGSVTVSDADLRVVIEFAEA